MKRAIGSLLVAGMLFAGLGAAALRESGMEQSSAQVGVPMVHGPLWKSSTLAEKRAYLVGVANTLAVGEALAAKKRGENPADSLNRMGKAISLQTIDQSVAEIDAWYKANPSRNDLPVLGVVYLRIVQDKN